MADWSPPSSERVWTAPTDERIGDPSPLSSRETSLPGLAASAARGMAPMAAGAGLGAALGAIPTMGIGAPVGAALGAGVIGAHEVFTNIYNPMAEVFGWPHMTTAQEMTDRVMDALGVIRPATAPERLTQSITGGAASALGPARAASEIAGSAVRPLSRAVAAKLATRPALQSVSGAVGGASAQGAAELGAGPTGQLVASTVGSAIPYGRSGLRASIAADPRRVAMEAHAAGYSLPPASFSEKPGILSTTLAALGGKIKTQQAASEHNQEVTNSLVGAELGVPPGTPLSPQVFEQIRQGAGIHYANVASAIPIVNADHAYDVIVANLGSRTAQARAFFPNITKNKGIDDLVAELQSVRQFPGRAGLDIVKQLRYEATVNLRSQDPKAAQLGLAQRQAADAIDGLIERNLAATGQQNLVNEYRAARQVIAKSYDVQSATNPATGDVRASRLAVLAAKGRPLTGNLDTVARVAAAFPKAVQMPAGFGHDEGMSALDAFFSIGSIAAGHPEAAIATFARAPVRQTILSRPYQGAMASTPQPATIPLPLLLQPGFGAVVPPTEP